MTCCTSVPKPLCHAIGAALVCVAAWASQPALAAPVTYDISFDLRPILVGQPGVAAPSGGTFTYDSNLQTLSEFSVAWDGLSFEITDFRELNGATGCGTGGQGLFNLLTLACSTEFVDYFWRVTVAPTGVSSGNGAQITFGALVNDGFSAFASSAQLSYSGTNTNGVQAGQWSVTAREPAVVSEPGTLALLGAAGAVLGLARRTRKTAAA
jgi:hypothetical protein